MASEDRKVYFSVSWVTIYAFTRAAEYIKNHKIKGRRCYLGEELVMRKNGFLVTLPPYSLQLQKIFRSTMESGITNLWYRESTEIGAAPRVQDRIRILSHTKILQEKPKPQPLELREGKLWNVFVLWMSCLLFCGISFVVEIILYFVGYACSVRHAVLHFLRNPNRLLYLRT